MKKRLQRIANLLVGSACLFVSSAFAQSQCNAEQVNSFTTSCSATGAYVAGLESSCLDWDPTHYRCGFYPLPSEVRNRVSAEVFNEVWSKVGDAFSIDPRLVRPDDTLKSLNAIDSWNLGKGGDALSQWLENKQLGKPPALETVLDLALWIEASKGTRKDV